MNTVSVKKTSNVIIDDLQIILQDGHYLVSHNKIHENHKVLRVWISEDSG